MKYLVVVLVILGGSSGLDQEFIDNFLEKMQKIGEVCAEETHATSDDIAELIEKKGPTSHEAKCMVFCFQRKFGMMKEDGTIDKVGSVLALDPVRDADPELFKKLLTIFVSCGEKATFFDDPCETGTQLMLCGRKEGEAAGIDDSLLG